MAGVNKVILVGNLGDDPEARVLNNGGEVVNLRVATSENWKDRDGNRQERTEWHRVVIFNENLGRVAKSYLKKGSKVYLEGQIQTRKWQDQSGQDRYSTEIVLQRFRGELVLLDSRGGGGGGGLATIGGDDGGGQRRPAGRPRPRSTRPGRRRSVLSRDRPRPRACVREPIWTSRRFPSLVTSLQLVLERRPAPRTGRLLVLALHAGLLERRLGIRARADRGRG